MIRPTQKINVLGHSIGEMAEAYKGVQYESLRDMYLEREKLLSPARRAGYKRAVHRREHHRQHLYGAYPGDD